MDRIKRIPYGKSDFETVNKQNDYYVDKTSFIPLIEKTPYIFLIRPRRFGKSLFLTTLQAYYDVKYKDHFEELYRDTWILQNPTEERGRYLVMYLNFSAVLKERDKVQDDFNSYCLKAINAFIRNNKKYLPESLIDLPEKDETAHEKLHTLATELSNSEYKIYLFIDEYDNFTNTILTDFGENEYKRITRQAGYFKQFFTNLKLLTSGIGSGLARLFITGVSPVTMDDVTSGFNLGDNISTDLKFNTLLGFTENDVSEILDYYISVGEFKIDKQMTLSLMKEWYNNYIFSLESRESVFNPDAVFYFVNKVIRNKKIPSYLIDDNLRMDYGKLRYLVMLDKKLNGNFARLTEIIDTGGISSNIKTSFPFDMLTQTDNFISLLYFFGLLSFSGKIIKSRPYLVIPNETVRTMLYEYIRESIRLSFDFNIDMLTLEDNIVKMAYDGDFKTAFKYIESQLQKQTSVRDFAGKENTVKIFYLSYLNIYDIYTAITEKELNKGYSDIVMIPFLTKYNDIEYAYLFEFKYIPRSVEENKLKQEIVNKVNEAESQLTKYSNDNQAKKLFGLSPYGNVILKKVIVVFYGWELAYCEESQLLNKNS